MTLSGRFWLPGPVEVHPDVMAAMSRPMINHRGAQAEALHARLQVGLRKIFQTPRPIMLATASATAMMECAIRSGVNDRVLCVVGGWFGERFATIAEKCGKEVIRLHVPPGEALTPELLAPMLDGPPVDAVTIVHAETSTGALAPVGELLAMLGQLEGVVTIIDAVASLGGSPVEPTRWGADFVLAGSQKALGLPPGLAFAAASDRFLERARSIEDRGLYLDAVALHDAAAQHRFPQTPALPQLHALDAQLARIEIEMLENRWTRHRLMRQAVEAWEASQDHFTLMAPVGRRADTVSVLTLAPGGSARRLVARLAEAGWFVATGRGSDADRAIRIGHMGDASVDQLAELLATLSQLR
jgi:aspartate aminotransferase-like enzyme